jgi:hypothetical protein
LIFWRLATSRAAKVAAPVNNVYDRFPRGQGFRPYVIEAILPAAGEDQLVKDAGEFLAIFLGGLYPYFANFWLLGWLIHGLYSSKIASLIYH